MAYDFRDNRRTNYYAPGRQDSAIDVIVLHHWGIEGQNWDNLTHWILTHQPRRMSVHYIAMDGKVERQVAEEDTAFHGGNVPINIRSIGIEARPEATDGDYDTVAELIADIWSRHGKLPIIGHNRVPSVRDNQAYVATGCPGKWDINRVTREAEAWYKKKYKTASSGGSSGSDDKSYPFDNPYKAAIPIQGYEFPRWRGSLKAIKRTGDIIQSTERVDVGDNAFVRCGETDGWYLVKANGRWQVSDASPKTYTVKAGDSPWSIAQRELGNGMRYVEILELNKLAEPTIYIGQKLEMPKE